MKKFTTLVFIAFFIQIAIYGQPDPYSVEIGTVTVTTPYECWITLISSEEASYGDYGWWSIWHNRKEYRQFAIANHNNNYTVVLPANVGIYTLVVYSPGSVHGDLSSDGVIIEELTIEYYYESEAMSHAAFRLEESDFVDWNCLSCPWLYVFDGTQYIKTTEVIKDVVGINDKQTTTYTFSEYFLTNNDTETGILKIKIQEEKDETSFLDRVSIKIGDTYYPATSSNGALCNDLLHEDNNYLILKKGESIELEFILPISVAQDLSVELLTTGYYEPSQAYIDEVYKKCLRSK